VRADVIEAMNIGVVVFINACDEAPLMVVAIEIKAKGEFSVVGGCVGGIEADGLS